MLVENTKVATCSFSRPNNKVNSLATWSRTKALCGRNSTQAKMRNKQVSFRDNPGSLLWRVNKAEKNNQKSKHYYLRSGQRS
jgi:hypothetical protein